MRILHLDSGRQMRGGQWQALFLVEALREAGHECILASPAGSPLNVEARERGVTVRDLSLSALAKCAAGMQLVHAHDARAHTLGLTICRLPLVVARRVAFPINRGPASRWKYDRADHFIAISNHVRDRLTDAGVPAERLSVVYDGVPVPSAPASGNLIIAPLTDDPRKGSGLAREAARLAGIELHFSSDLMADLPKARMFLYLSEDEGLGSAALLASAYGVPVIASAVGGLREAVEDQRTGLLTENRAEAVAASIRRLVEDPSAARDMGAAGRQRVERQFTIASMASGTLAVYERLSG